MTFRVIFAPEAEDQFDELYRYIARRATAEIAERYVGQVIDYCEGLVAYPLRRTARDDIRPGLRTTSYRKRTVIAFAVVAEYAPQPGVADLVSLARRDPVPVVDVELAGDLAGLRLQVDAAVYRLAQEALTKALRHARNASRVEIRVVEGAAARVTGSTL